MCFGENLGFQVEQRERAFESDYGLLIVQFSDAVESTGDGARPDEASPEATRSDHSGGRRSAPGLGSSRRQRSSSSAAASVAVAVARPRVLIPVFPGTNCEDDTAAAFEAAGAVTSQFVLHTGSTELLQDSLRDLATALAESQILMLSGGFSAGDEPAGSGTYIAAVLRSPAIREVIERYFVGADLLADLDRAGQVAARYVDFQGRTRYDRPWNPSGSDGAVEALLSLDGCFLGKMGHTERARPGLDRHLPPASGLDLFAAGMRWFQ